MAKRKEIVMVATYEGLFHRASKIVKEHGYPVEVIQGNMETIENTYSQINALKPEVVICRGGTYLLLKKNFPNLILVEIKVSAYDILKSCEGINEIKGAIGFLGYANVVFGMDIFEKITERKVYSVNFQKRESVETVQASVRQLAEKGVTYFVGDHISHHVALDMGYPSHMVETDDTTIIQVIGEALHLLEVKLREQMVASRYKLIVDTVSDGIISIDRYQEAPLLNRSAEYFCMKHNIDPKELVNLMGLDEKKSDQGIEIKTLGENCSVAIRKSPIEVDDKILGMVATFQNTTQIQKLEEKIRTELSKKGLTAKYTFNDILYNSDIMKKVVRNAKKFANSEATVLIQAATGTGKELFAQSIHNASPRAKKPFVAINCAALSENLLESELFGYTDGAFTGAKKGGKIGLVELAHTGTLFLDEIGDMPINLQTRLLRVIQEREVMRIGDEKIAPVDVRIIAATNMDLEDHVEAGSFRRDLYYRLNILTLKIPTLDERPGDIILLANKLMTEVALLNKKLIRGFESDALDALMNHRYQGNVRELKGIIERAVVLADNTYITLSDLDIRPSKKEDTPVGKTIQNMEQQLLEDTLEEYNYNYSKTAKVLGIDRSTLYRKTKHLRNSGKL